MRVITLINIIYRGSGLLCRTGCDKWRQLRRERQQGRNPSDQLELRPAPASGWRPACARRTMTQCGVTPKRCCWVGHSAEPSVATTNHRSSSSSSWSTGDPPAAPQLHFNIFPRRISYHYLVMSPAPRDARGFHLYPGSGDKRACSVA